MIIPLFIPSNLYSSSFQCVSSYGTLAKCQGGREKEGERGEAGYKLTTSLGTL